MKKTFGPAGSKVKRALIFSLGLLLILVGCGTKEPANPSETEDYQKLDQAFNQKDYKYLENKVLAEDDTSFDQKTLDKIVAYKSLEDYSLADEKEQIYLENIGSGDKPNYIVRVRPVEVNIKTDLEDGLISIDGKEVGKLDENGSISLEDISYGSHRLNLIYETVLGSWDEEIILDVDDFSKASLEEKLDLDLNYVTLQADDSKAVLYIDGNKSDLTFVNGPIELGPYPKDSQVEVAAVVDGSLDQALVRNIKDLKDQDILLTNEGLSLGMDKPFVVNINEGEEICLVKGDKLLRDQTMDGYLAQWNESAVGTVAARTQKNLAYYLFSDQIDFIDEGVSNIKISDDGSTVAYLKGGRLYRYKPENKKAQPYSLDNILVGDFNLSPNGEHLAYQDLDSGDLIIDNKTRLPVEEGLEVLALDDDLENIYVAVERAKDPSSQWAYWPSYQISRLDYKGKKEDLGTSFSFIIFSPDRKTILFDYDDQVGKGILSYDQAKGLNKYPIENKRGIFIYPQKENLRTQVSDDQWDESSSLAYYIGLNEDLSGIYFQIDEAIGDTSRISFYRYDQEKLEFLVDFDHYYTRYKTLNYVVDEKNNYFYYANGSEAVRLNMETKTKELLEAGAEKVVAVDDVYYYMDKDHSLYQVDGQGKKTLIKEKIVNFVVNSKHVVGIMTFDYVAGSNAGYFYYDGRLEKISSKKGNVILRDDNVLYHQFGSMPHEEGPDSVVYAMKEKGRMVQLDQASFMLYGIFMEIPIEY